MRKGFFLTESEKNRISNLYGGSKIFLLEATDPPTEVEEVKAFMDWADTKDPNWVLLSDNPRKTGTSKRSDGTPRKMYGNPNSGSYKRAWAASGETYLNEKGGSAGRDKKWRVWNEKDKKYEGPYTIEELKTKFSKNEISGETYVAHPDITANKAMKAKNVKQLEMPGEPLSPSESTASTPSVDYQYIKGTKSERPETALDKYYKQGQDEKTIPGPEDLTYRQKTSDGFKSWAKKSLGVSFDDIPEKNLKIEGNRITTTDQYGVQRVYDYDDKTQEWKHPNFTTNIQIIAKPETDKQQ